MRAGSGGGLKSVRILPLLFCPAHLLRAQPPPPPPLPPRAAGRRDRRAPPCCLPSSVQCARAAREPGSRFPPSGRRGPEVKSRTHAAEPAELPATRCRAGLAGLQARESWGMERNDGSQRFRGGRRGPVELPAVRWMPAFE